MKKIILLTITIITYSQNVFSNNLNSRMGFEKDFGDLFMVKEFSNPYEVSCKEMTPLHQELYKLYFEFRDKMNLTRNDVDEKKFPLIASYLKTAYQIDKEKISIDKNSEFGGEYTTKLRQYMGKKVSSQWSFDIYKILLKGQKEKWCGDSGRCDKRPPFKIEELKKCLLSAETMLIHKSYEKIKFASTRHIGMTIQDILRNIGSSKKLNVPNEFIKELDLRYNNFCNNLKKEIIQETETSASSYLKSCFQYMKRKFKKTSPQDILCENKTEYLCFLNKKLKIVEN